MAFLPDNAGATNSAGKSTVMVRFWPAVAPTSCSVNPGIKEPGLISSQKLLCWVSPRAVGAISVSGLPSVVPE